MRRSSAGLVFMHALLVLLASAGWARAQENPERRLYDEADSALNSGLTTAAANALERFLEQYPQSPLAPQARYKLGCAQVLQVKPAEAEKTYRQLVENHFGSPWAKLALRTMFNEDQLYNLANETRLHGRQPGQSAASAMAVELYQLLVERFPNTTKNRGELLFKMGNFQAVLAVARDSGWAKLAEIVVGGSPVFCERMDEMLRLDDVGEEGTRTLLELSDRWLSGLDGQSKAKCLHYRGRCFTNLSNDAEAVAAYQAVVKDYPSSEFAAESAFWLAERELGQRNFPKARDAYRAFAQQYAYSPRATRTLEWAAWLDSADGAWKELEQALAQTGQQLTDGKGGIAFHLHWQSAEPGKSLEGRFALQDASHVFVGLGPTSGGLLLANNAQGSWYRPAGQGVLLKVRQGLALPMPQGVINADALTSTFNFNFQANPGITPSLKVSPAAATLCVTLMKAALHVTREPGDGPAVRYRLERARGDNPQPDAWEITLDSGRHLREVRYICHNGKGEKTVFEVTDIRLGEPLAESEFQVPSDGMAVREIDAINPMEIVGHLMSLGGSLFQTAKTQRQ